MIWIAWVGVMTLWLAAWSWAMGFGRQLDLRNNRDDMVPTQAIQSLNIVLCGSAVIESLIGVVFIVYGLVSIWIR